MAKAKLSKVTENWIDDKTAKKQDSKPSKQQKKIERIKQTVYIAKEASALLWHNRAETGETISQAVENLIMKHLSKK